jgi:hypothetical protein
MEIIAARALIFSAIVILIFSPTGTAPGEKSSAAAVADFALSLSQEWNGRQTQKQTSSECAPDPSGQVNEAPGKTSAEGVAGTTTQDLKDFAHQYNAIRVQNCLQPIPYSNFFYDTCMETRLFWMAESPSPDYQDGWGHMGSARADGEPSVGCDGNLAGGSDDDGAVVAQKWWDSLPHRASLYRPGESISGVCISLAVVHGGVDEPVALVRAAARWNEC